jgi:predicted HicB family RNase H-like nuclease
MAISKENIRTMLTLSKKLKQQLEKEAAKDNRSFNNYVVTILENRSKKEG